MNISQLNNLFQRMRLRTSEPKKTLISWLTERVRRKWRGLYKISHEPHRPHSKCIHHFLKLQNIRRKTRNIHYRIHHNQTHIKKITNVVSLVKCHRNHLFHPHPKKRRENSLKQYARFTKPNNLHSSHFNIHYIVHS